MEIRTLNKDFEWNGIIDTFESFVWTERFNTYGDFELTVPSTKDYRSLLPVGVRIGTDVSNRIMTIETHSFGVDADGKDVMTIKGRSLEAMLLDRIARVSSAGTDDSPVWTLQGTIVDIINQVFERICIDGEYSAADIIPFIGGAAGNDPGDIGFPDDFLTVEIKPQTVYKVITDLCQQYNIGFKLIRDLWNPELTFSVYSGNNRTTSKIGGNPIIFSPILDTINGISQLISIDDYKNVAVVLSPYGMTEVAEGDMDPFSFQGWDRKVLLVEVTDLKEEPSNLDAVLKKRGLEALAEHRALKSLDGEVSQSSRYAYDSDRSRSIEWTRRYSLGDLVEMRDEDGVVNNMRVTEQIFTHDAEGFRSYPTLTLDTYISPDTWYGWPFTQTWPDVDGYWADQ